MFLALSCTAFASVIRLYMYALVCACVCGPEAALQNFCDGVAIGASFCVCMKFFAANRFHFFLVGRFRSASGSRILLVASPVIQLGMFLFFSYYFCPAMNHERVYSTLSNAHLCVNPMHLLARVIMCEF